MPDDRASIASGLVWPRCGAEEYPRVSGVVHRGKVLRTSIFGSKSQSMPKPKPIISTDTHAPILPIDDLTGSSKPLIRELRRNVCKGNPSSGTPFAILSEIATVQSSVLDRFLLHELVYRSR
jgi:hypothetical protein